MGDWQNRWCTPAFSELFTCPCLPVCTPHPGIQCSTWYNEDDTLLQTLNTCVWRKWNVYVQTNRRLIEDQGLVLVSSAEQWRLALSLRCFWMGSYCTSEPISKTPAFLILPLTGQRLIPEIVQLTLGWGTPTPQIGAILSSPPLQVLVKGYPSIYFQIMANMWRKLLKSGTRPSQTLKEEASCP